jgi:RES domain-containing protein
MTCRRNLRCLKIAGPDVETPFIKVNTLPTDWQTQLEVARDVGTTWLQRNENVLLRVPSVIVPETANFLFNPSHKLATTFQITGVFTYPFDLRLKS